MLFLKLQIAPATHRPAARGTDRHVSGMPWRGRRTFRTVRDDAVQCRMRRDDGGHEEARLLFYRRRGFDALLAVVTPLPVVTIHGGIFGCVSLCLRFPLAVAGHFSCTVICFRFLQLDLWRAAGHGRTGGVAGHQHRTQEPRKQSGETLCHATQSTIIVAYLKIKKAGTCKCLP